MKSKLYASLVVACVVCLIGLTGYAQKSASPMQHWQYKIIVRARSYPTGYQVTQSVSASDWTQVAEDGKALTPPINMLAKLNDLGAQGWELVTFVPRSSSASTWSAGAVTDEEWVFKRPAP